MSAPKVDVDALRVQVKAQSERIRQMKKAGAAQEEVQAEVAILQVLKADLEKVADQAEVRASPHALEPSLLCCPFIPP
jgi:hypothetical protein